MALTNNKKLNDWLDEMIALVNPKEVVLIDGSEEQAEQLRAEACATGEMFKLNQEKLPGCYLHRTAVNDVARVEGRTFICSRTKEDAGATNNWMDPQECYEKLGKLYKGSYTGRTMYVIPYSMGVVGSEFAKNGIELTDDDYSLIEQDLALLEEQCGGREEYIKFIEEHGFTEEEMKKNAEFSLYYDKAMQSLTSKGGKYEISEEEINE
ncbi:MAG: phosphoenolpyruvate carboxykinase, partial [Clostridia bacterium]|nr:phosphoenolpyruvate carboxykinase [Clostridia bacterium]